MNIVEAVKALAEGKKIRRNDWEKGHYITLIYNQVVSQNGWTSGLCIDDFSADWWEIYEEPILDDEEKKYLSAVIKPFRDRVKYIKKLEAYCGCKDIGENIFIRLCGKDGLEEFFSLPWFPKGSMYKNMELGKEYSLKDLGL